MKMARFFAISVFVLFLSYTSATFEEEMQALEKDMMADSTESKDTIKKSIKDLSTEELIAELEKEFHDTKSDDLNKKYRKRFENIINKREKLDKLTNADIKTLFAEKKEVATFDELTAELFKEEDDRKRQAIISAEGDCKDLRADCKALTGFCLTHREKLEKACAYSCGYCVKCKQDTSLATCKYLKANGMCNANTIKIRNRMVRLCPLTCGHCKVPSPPHCSKTEFGCCWDKMTIKANKPGKNCPKCQDAYKYVCKTFKPDCDSFYKPGEFMRHYCPAQCDLCSGKCRDDKEKEAVCPMWDKEFQWCAKKKSIMRLYCPKTCKFC